MKTLVRGAAALLLVSLCGCRLFEAEEVLAAIQ